MPRNLPLILASTSPRRADLLREAHIPFIIRTPRVRESSQDDSPHLTPRQLALYNAKLKGLAVSQKHPDRWVLAADTIVVLGSKVLGKPRNMKHAENMLADLNGRMHRVITGIFLVKNFSETSLTITSKVYFRKLTLNQRRAYLESIQPLDKAGAYAAQNHGGEVIRKIEGSFSNVVGLPIEKVLQILRKRSIISDKGS